MKYSFAPAGVCSSRIDFELDNGIIRNVSFTGGCNGNLKALSALTEGMSANQAIEKLQGITCGLKSTSCPDQFARALTEAKTKQADREDR